MGGGVYNGFSIIEVKLPSTMKLPIIEGVEHTMVTMGIFSIKKKPQKIMEKLPCSFMHLFFEHVTPPGIDHCLGSGGMTWMKVLVVGLVLVEVMFRKSFLGLGDLG